MGSIYVSRVFLNPYITNRTHEFRTVWKKGIQRVKQQIPFVDIISFISSASNANYHFRAVAAINMH